MTETTDEAASAAGQTEYDLDEVLAQVIKDDQEEWEYEYSATETEVSSLCSTRHDARSRLLTARRRPFI